MTLVDISLDMVTEVKEKDLKKVKKEARVSVKNALDLFNKGRISEEMLKAIAEMALAMEISEGLEIKLEKKNTKLFSK